MINLFLDQYLLTGSLQWRINGELYRKLLKISRRLKRNSNQQKCKLGEIYVPYQLTKQLRTKGFRRRKGVFPMSYLYIPQYPQFHDIDMYLRLVDKNLIIYRCYINIYNWGKYHYINDRMFKRRFLSTFNRIDPRHTNIWIVAMNFRNIPLIENRCREHDIYILPLKEHITIDLLERIQPDEDSFENSQ